MDATPTAEAPVLIDKMGAVTTLTLNYPARRNALSLPLRAAMIEAMEAAMADAACRAIVITGGGGHFCAGGDISSMDGITALEGRARLGRLHALFTLMTQGPKPVIGAVEGHAAGAGLSLAAACDLVVAAEDSIFSCTFNRIGLMPDFGASWTVPLRVGLGRAKKIMMLGERFDGREAERIGLAESVAVPGQALADAQEMAAKLAEVAPAALTLTKQALGRLPMDAPRALGQEGDLQGILFDTDDFAEGRTAFLEKRKPHFIGK